jgi:hypothetical protein
VGVIFVTLEEIGNTNVVLRKGVQHRGRDALLKRKC